MAGDERVHLFGIRHHGPGSAASLEAALTQVDPAIVLIEGPADADSLIPYASLPGMRPPVALLAYAAEDPAVAAFYPFADFSPEWRAMLWSLSHDRPVRFIDLPASANIAWMLESKKAAEGTDDGDGADTSREHDDRLFEGDPLDALAELTGHSDGEAWWNAQVEMAGPGQAVFDAIAEAMTALREEWERTAAPSRALVRERQREAHMRQAIRAALREQAGQVAVVAGAWHVPALRLPVFANDDRALVRGIPRAKTELAWVPWTETRLAAGSGYGAGVISPGWYGHLWSRYAGGHWPVPVDLAASWQTCVAGMLREEGLAADTASVIEAARLAGALAALRDLPLPGLAEMNDAALSILCQGNSAPFRLIETHLVIGQRVGEVDESVPQVPLAKDLARWQKKVRLAPEAAAREVSMDLRTETGLLKSVLLHRLTLIDVPWGRLIDAQAGRGTFREIWMVQWRPELSVQLAEAVIHGPTIEEASGNAAIASTESESRLPKLAETVRATLLADLPAAAERCIRRLQAVAIDTVDIPALMDAVPPLVSILRYGTARRIPEESLRSLATALAGEVIAGVQLACRNLDADSAAAMRRSLEAFDAALPLAGDDQLEQRWREVLAVIAEDGAVSPLIAGSALRRIYDAGTMAQEQLEAAFSRALSPSLPPGAVGAWLEGFIGDNAELLLHDDVLFELLDAWLVAQREEEFVETLPMLRRSFSGFDVMQRKRMFERAGRTGDRDGARATATPILDPDPAFQRALPLLLTILGHKEGRDGPAG